MIQISATEDQACPAQLSKTDGSSTSQHFWLMKAEPESRIENGIDVKFSIDDLAAKTAPGELF